MSEKGKLFNMKWYSGPKSPSRIFMRFGAKFDFYTQGKGAEY